MYKTISWNTGLAAERARHNLKLKKKKRPAARKLQAASRKRAIDAGLLNENEWGLPRATSTKRQASSSTKKTQLNDIVRLESYKCINTKLQK